MEQLFIPAAIYLVKKQANFKIKKKKIESGTFFGQAVLNTYMWIKILFFLNDVNIGFNLKFKMLFLKYDLAFPKHS